jgi:hypothetical protein
MCLQHRWAMVCHLAVFETRSDAMGQPTVMRKTHCVRSMDTQCAQSEFLPRNTSACPHLSRSTVLTAQWAEPRGSCRHRTIPACMNKHFQDETRSQSAQRAFSRAVCQNLDSSKDLTSGRLQRQRMSWECPNWSEGIAQRGNMDGSERWSERAKGKHKKMAQPHLAATTVAHRRRKNLAITTEASF